MDRRIFPLAALCLLLAGCAAPARTETVRFFAMDTAMSVTAAGSAADARAAEDEIDRLDALWSIGSADSEIARLNAGETASVGDETAALLARALEISACTGGAFDCTVYPLEAAWGFYSGDYRVPSDGELAALLPRVGYEKFSLSGGAVTFAVPGMAVDPGGIAKGAAAGKAAALLRARGVTSAVLNLGGNVRAVGSKPDGSPWRVGLADPDDPSASFAVLSVSVRAVVTSGDYQRYFEKDGVRYHHILDPATGRPADSGLRAVTVVTDDDALADGLSTALFVLGREKAAALWRASDDFEAVFFASDGTISVTEGLKDVFSSERPWEVIAR